MENLELFNRIVFEWKDKLHFLDDKPEETIQSTIKALWCKAAGISLSAERALTNYLPTLNKKELAKLQMLIKLRSDNIPLAYITGRQNFMGIDLITDKRALIPRKETELLGNKALSLSLEKADLNRKTFIMDVCCGAGNLGIAVAYYNPNCILYASDISQDAVDLTQENINMLNLHERVNVRQGDLMSAFETDDFYEKFDLIICNPPYIISSNVPKMDEEISSNEPTIAFDGGMLGIKIIQKLVQRAPGFLRKSGWLVFEVGVGQGQFISQICERTNLYKQIQTATDDSDKIRVVMVQK